MAKVSESKTFDTETLEGLKAAERYQQSLYEKYNTVTVKPLGLTRTTITGENPIKPFSVGHTSCIGKTHYFTTLKAAEKYLDTTIRKQDPQGLERGDYYIDGPERS